MNFAQISPSHRSWYDHENLTPSSRSLDQQKFSWSDSQPLYPSAPPSLQPAPDTAFFHLQQLAFQLHPKVLPVGLVCWEQKYDSDLFSPVLLWLVLFQSVEGLPALLHHHHPPPPTPGTSPPGPGGCPAIVSTDYTAFFTIFCFNYQIHQDSVYPVLVSFQLETGHLSQDNALFYMLSDSKTMTLKGLVASDNSPFLIKEEPGCVYL